MDSMSGGTERIAGANPMRALLIEDNRADAVLLQELLLDAGRATLELTWDDRLGKAVDRLRTDRFDAILLDLTLPDSQGLATLERILGPASATPIIVLTGVEDEEVAIRAIRQGAQDYLVKGTVDGRAIARAIRYAIDRKQAEQALREARDRLEERVRERTAELAATNARLQALASELSLAEERERRRLATVLHDDVGQTVALAKLKLGLLGQLLETADSKAALAAARELINQIAKRVRTLTSDLSPPILYQLGLAGAVEWLGERFGQQYGVPCRCQAMGDPQGAAEAVNVLLFQSARELLANIGKHANAHEVEMALAYADGGVTLAVRDDGVGFDPDSLRTALRTKESFGLFSIEERMRHIGGTMRIDSAPGKGTTVTLSCPGSPRRA